MTTPRPSTTCRVRHSWLPVGCILAHNHTGPHWGPLPNCATDRHIEWRGDVGRVITAGNTEARIGVAPLRVVK